MVLLLSIKCIAPPHKSLTQQVEEDMKNIFKKIMLGILLLTMMPIVYGDLFDKINGGTGILKYKNNN